MSQKYIDLIKQICDEQNIDCTMISDDWIFKLEKDGKVKYIYGYKFDLNSHGIGLVIDDKYGLYNALKSSNISAVGHDIVYDRKHPKYTNNYEYVKEYFLNHNNHIVIKPNHGSGGKGVYNIESIDTIKPTMDKLFIKNTSIAICPFYNAENEYRAVILDKKIRLIYQKNRPRVIGDGTSSIRELLKNVVHANDINLDNEEYSRVLNLGETYEYGWKFNAQAGATIQLLKDEDVLKSVTQIAEKVLEKVDLRFGNIDILRNKNNEYYVLELNSGVDVVNIAIEDLSEDERYNLAKGIYADAIKLMFE